MGLVSGVYPQDGFMDSVYELAGKIVRNGPDNIRYAKKAVVEGIRISSAGLALENELWGRCFAGDEPKKRVQRFFAKSKGK